jgi:hypothetical protein
LEGNTDSARLEHIRNELEPFSPAIRDELASDLSALSPALGDLAYLALESHREDSNAWPVSIARAA